MRFRLLVSLTLSLTTLAVSQAPVQKPGVRIPDGGAYRADAEHLHPAQTGRTLQPDPGCGVDASMANGGTFTLVNERRIMRDGKGRIYQERWILVPKGGKVKSQMNVFQITDPDPHLVQLRGPSQGMRVAAIPSDGRTEVPSCPTGTSGPLPNGSGSRLHEDLGSSTTEAWTPTAIAKRLTINEGVMGNDKPMVTMREFWYSPQLGINLLSTVDSPQSGKQVFTVKDVSISEPDSHSSRSPRAIRSSIIGMRIPRLTTKAPPASPRPCNPPPLSDRLWSLRRP